MRHAKILYLAVLVAGAMLVCRPAMAAFTLSGGGGATPSLSSVMAVGNTTDYMIDSTGYIATTNYFVLKGAATSFYSTASAIPINMKASDNGTAAFLLEHTGTAIGLKLINETANTSNLLYVEASDITSNGNHVILGSNTSLNGEAIRAENTNTQNNTHSLAATSNSTSATVSAVFAMAISGSGVQDFIEGQNGSTDTWKITNLGGYAIAMVNLTGATVPRGTVVEVATSAYAVGISEYGFASASASSPAAIGVVYGNTSEAASCGVDAQCYIIISGVAEVQHDFLDGASCTKGGAMKTSITPGTAVNDGDIWPIDGQLIGIALETSVNGTDELCKVKLQL